jgi:hypothetical protein
VVPGRNTFERDIAFDALESGSQGFMPLDHPIERFTHKIDVQAPYQVKRLAEVEV